MMAWSNKRTAALVWHLIALSSCIYGFKSLDVLSDLMGVDMTDEYGGFFQFLTMCGLTATTSTISLALILDLVHGPEALRWLKDLLMAVSLPTETIITALYWSLMTINKDLLMQTKKVTDPTNPDQVLREESVAVPFWIDASMHGFPSLFLLVDLLVFSRRFPDSIPVVVVTTAVTAAYGLWAGKCASMNGHYPYPLLDILSAPQRVALYVGAGALASLAGVAVIRLQARVKSSHGSAAKANVNKTK